MAQWTKRLTRTGQTLVRIQEALIFDIAILCRAVFLFLHYAHFIALSMSFHYIFTFTTLHSEVYVEIVMSSVINNIKTLSNASAIANVSIKIRLLTSLYRPHVT